MSSDLQRFDDLKASITVFVSPTLQLKVSDAASSATGIDVAKQIRGFLKEVDERRRELVDPLNQQVKNINEYVKSLTAPLERADQHVKGELNLYAAQQEKIRQEELRRAREEAARLEAEAQSKLAAERAALQAKQMEEAKAHSEAESLFGADLDDHLEHAAAGDKAVLEAQLAREAAALEAVAERERMARIVALKQKEFDANQEQIKNTRKTFKCEMLDQALVPKEFLVVTLNEKAVLAAARSGVKEIAGVRIWQEVSVAIGTHTAAPRLGRS